jgi:hypothetical protein
MNCHGFWRYLFLSFHSLTLLGIMILVTAKTPPTSGPKIDEAELAKQLANKTLYLESINWIVSSNPSVQIIDNQFLDNINIVFFEISDNKSIRLKEPKFSSKENDKNDNVIVKMKSFCKSYAERIRGRMIVTKTSVIDSVISE